MIIACIAAGGDPNVVAASDPYAATVDQVPGYTLLAAFRSLPAESQNLSYLADVTGLSYRQMAGVLGLPADAVAARLQHTRQRLRRGFCI